MDEVIQFVANYGEWRSIRKMKVTDQTPPLRIIEFLATLTYSIDSKIEENLSKIGSLDQVNAFLDENVDEGRGEQEIAKALRALQSTAFGKLVKEISEGFEGSKPEKKEIASIIRIYATRKALGKVKLFVDFSQAEVKDIKKSEKKKEKLAEKEAAKE